MILSLKFSNWDIEARMVPMDGVVMAFEAAPVSEHAVALSTGNHGAEGRESEVSYGICRSLRITDNR